MGKLKNFYEGKYARYVLPGVLLQSVLIGGGYATGREIYSYGAKFGSMGWIAGLTIGIGFALFAFLTFEICRIYKVYDYKNYIQKVIGPLWPVMDILTVLIAILLIAVMAAATGSIFEQAGMPNILGSVVIVLICGFLNFKGSKLIEKFESVGTILLYVRNPGHTVYSDPRWNRSGCFHRHSKKRGVCNQSPLVCVKTKKGKTSVLPSKNCFAILVGFPLRYEHFPIHQKGGCCINATTSS